MKKHLAQWHTDSDTGFRYRYVIGQTEKFVEHCHDYYEVFIVLEGKVQHTVNGVKSILKTGDLVFIRPDDIHLYEYDGIDNYCFSNLCFNSEIAHSLFNYIKDGCDITALLTTHQPPTVKLTYAETQKLFDSLQTINTAEYDDASEKILKMKCVLFNIFTKYFAKYKVSEESYALWFEHLCDEIKKPINFQKQNLNLSLICGKSKEHIARTFKRNTGMTTSEYINDIRLNYAANLLKNTDISILEVSLESGFSNLSWFYRKFFEKYGTTPKDFRGQRISE